MPVAGEVARVNGVVGEFIGAGQARPSWHPMAPSHCRTISPSRVSRGQSCRLVRSRGAGRPASSRVAAPTQGAGLSAKRRATP